MGDLEVTAMWLGIWAEAWRSRRAATAPAPPSTAIPLCCRGCPESGVKWGVHCPHLLDDCVRRTSP